MSDASAWHGTATCPECGVKRMVEGEPRCRPCALDARDRFFARLTVTGGRPLRLTPQQRRLLDDHHQAHSDPRANEVVRQVAHDELASAFQPWADVDYIKAELARLEEDRSVSDWSCSAIVNPQGRPETHWRCGQINNTASLTCGRCRAPRLQEDRS